MSVETIKSRVSELLDASKDVQVEFFDREMDTPHRKYDSDEVHTFKATCEFNFTLVDQHGGEGEGEDYWTVYSFTDNKDTIYVKFQGWYQSYSGSELSEWKFVEPKERMVTFYE